MDSLKVGEKAEAVARRGLADLRNARTRRLKKRGGRQDPGKDRQKGVLGKAI